MFGILIRRTCNTLTSTIAPAPAGTIALFFVLLFYVYWGADLLVFYLYIGITLSDYNIAHGQPVHKS